MGQTNVIALTNPNFDSNNNWPNKYNTNFKLAKQNSQLELNKPRESYRLHPAELKVKKGHADDVIG